MASNWFNNINNTEKDINPLILSYKNKIDINQDGQISEEELLLFEKENPEIVSSLFNGNLPTNTEGLSQNDTSIFSESGSPANINADNKDVYVNIADLEGMDFDSFSQLGNSENNNETTNKFWETVSEFDLSKLFSFINTDNDEVLSKDELMQLSSEDETNENLSLYDLQEFINKTNDEMADSNGETIDETKEKSEEEKNINTKRKASTGNYSGSRNSVDTVDNVDTVINEKVRLTNDMETAKTAFSTAKSNYESFLDGNINNPDINAKKEDMDNAYASWQEELSKQDPALSENINTATVEVETVNQQISQNEKEIFNNKINLSDCTAAYENAKSFREGLEDKKGELESSLAGLDSSDEANANRIEAYRNQISKIKTDINNAITEEENAKNAKEKAQKELNDSNAEKLVLQSSLEAKQAVLSQYVAESEQISANNTVLMNLQNDYENKKNIYEKALNDYKASLKTNAESKHEDLIEKKNLISDYEKNDKIKSYNSPALDYDSNFAAIFNSYLLAGASDHSKSDCGGAVRRALSKAVEEIYGKNASAVFENPFGVIGADWNDEYLADCPLFTDITDLYSTSEITEMIQNGELEGAIINYEKYSGGKSGHVEGVTTKGLTSDYTRPHSYFRSKSKLGQADYHIYIPRIATEEEMDNYIQLMQARKSSYDSPIL